MSHTLYLVYSGLQSRADALDVLSHNLANLQSVGYKKQRFAFEIRDVLTAPGASEIARATNGPLVRTGARVDFSAGELTETGNPLDLALAGDGFFAVLTPAGVRYTRNGHFQLDGDGRLVDTSGYPVLANDPQPREITLPTGSVEVSPAGQISVDGIAVATLKVVTFQDLAGMKALGGGLFEPPQGARELPPQELRVLQGYLEASNVDPVAQVMEMVSLMRSFEILSQAARSLSRDVDDRLVNELAKP